MSKRRPSPEKPLVKTTSKNERPISLNGIWEEDPEAYKKPKTSADTLLFLASFNPPQSVKPQISWSTMPNELLVKIFSNLDPVTSTCLGLTSSRFYAVHSLKWDTVPITARLRFGKANKNVLIKRLSTLVKDWMRPSYEWSNAQGKFIRQMGYHNGKSEIDSKKKRIEKKKEKTSVGEGVARRKTWRERRDDICKGRNVQAGRRLGTSKSRSTKTR